MSGFTLTSTEFRRLWVEELRSGAHRQGQTCLATTDSQGDRFCCLGVACEVYIREGGDLERFPTGAFYEYWSNGGQLRDTTYLPRRVAEALGYGNDLDGVSKNPDGFNPRVELDEDHSETLATLNDTGLTFSQIADVLEYSWRRQS